MILFVFENKSFTERCSVRKLVLSIAASIACIGVVPCAVLADPTPNQHAYLRYSFPLTTPAFYYVTTAGDLHHSAASQNDAINREAWIYFDGDPINLPSPQYYLESGLTDGYGWHWDPNGTYSPSTGTSSYTYWNGFFSAVTFVNGQNVDEQDDFTYGAANPTGSHTVEMDQIGTDAGTGKYIWSVYIDGAQAYTDNGDLNFANTKGVLAGTEASDTLDTFQNGVTMSNINYTDTGVIAHPGSGDQDIEVVPTGWAESYDNSTGTITFNR